MNTDALLFFPMGNIQCFYVRMAERSKVLCSGRSLWGVCSNTTSDHCKFLRRQGLKANFNIPYWLHLTYNALFFTIGIKINVGLFGNPKRNYLVGRLTADFYVVIVSTLVLESSNSVAPSRKNVCNPFYSTLVKKKISWILTVCIFFHDKFKVIVCQSGQEV